MVHFGQEVQGGFSEYYPDGIKKVHFNPYSNNGGSIIGIAGDDFAIVAADTRLNSGYSIVSREQKKLFPLSETTVLGCGGCWCDAINLTKNLSARMQMYKHEHQKSMSTAAAAQMLSIMLYHKRFFPYYVSNTLCGFDENGKGVVYSYDPIGHFEKCKFIACGSSGPLLSPLLDNQLGHYNQENIQHPPLDLQRALAICKDAFIAAKERDTEIGDGVYIQIITKDGIKEDFLKLRKD